MRDIKVIHCPIVVDKLNRRNLLINDLTILPHRNTHRWSEMRGWLKCKLIARRKSCPSHDIKLTCGMSDLLSKP